MKKNESSRHKSVERTQTGSVPATLRVLLVLCGLALSTPAWAYLDPTTGSMVISAIVGIFASIALALKTYWYKVKNLFRRGSSEPAAAEEAGKDTPE